MTTNNQKPILDGWSSDGQTFIINGMGYRVNKNLQSCCVGPVDGDGEPATPLLAHPTSTESPENPVTPHQTTNSIGQEDVTTLVDAKIKEFSAQGKPTREIASILKAEGIYISHMTVARRLAKEKVEQGVLL